MLYMLVLSLTKETKMIEIKTRQKAPSVEKIIQTAHQKSERMLQEMSKKLIVPDQAWLDNYVQAMADDLEAKGIELQNNGRQMIKTGEMQKAQAWQDMTLTLRRAIANL
jgi:t-SNARE complex subunit (syntaxin)